MPQTGSTWNSCFQQSYETVGFVDSIGKSIANLSITTHRKEARRGNPFAYTIPSSFRGGKRVYEGYVYESYEGGDGLDPLSPPLLAEKERFICLARW